MSSVTSETLSLARTAALLVAGAAMISLLNASTRYFILFAFDAGIIDDTRAGWTALLHFAMLTLLFIICFRYGRSGTLPNSFSTVLLGMLSFAFALIRY
jgi:hypothetical protein